MSQLMSLLCILCHFVFCFANWAAETGVWHRWFVILWHHHSLPKEGVSIWWERGSQFDDFCFQNILRDEWGHCKGWTAKQPTSVCLLGRSLLLGSRTENARCHNQKDIGRNTHLKKSQWVFSCVLHPDEWVAFMTVDIICRATVD